MKIGDRHPELIPAIVDLWHRKLSESPDKKKLSLVYVANELINKSKALDENNRKKEKEKLMLNAS